MECNPLIIDGVLCSTTAELVVVALDAASGELKWQFDPFALRATEAGGRVNRSGVNRGLSHWTNDREARLLYVSENYLYAIDAKTGKLVPSFGRDGRVDLKKGLGRDIDTLSYSATSPGIIYDDLYIMGSRVSPTYPSAPGHIRAFNIVTGEQAWRFNTIPHPGEFGYDTWPPETYKTAGGANLWSGPMHRLQGGRHICPRKRPSKSIYSLLPIKRSNKIR